jgi:hypothetical protein
MSGIEFPYDQTQRPPAPVVEITITGQGVGRATCRAVVDSGLSVSCIPTHILDSLRAPDSVEVQIRTFLGDKKGIRKREVTVGLGSKQAKLEVLPLDGDVALLGRDFLNDCVVVLDGRAQKVSVSD